MESLGCMRIPVSLDPTQARAFRRWRLFLLVSLCLWAVTATAFLAAAPYMGSASQRVEGMLVPFFVCICCCAVIVVEPLFAASFVVTTMALAAAGSASLAPIFLMLLFGWGGGPRSAEDSRLLYCLVAYWITNAVGLVVALRYTRILWSSIPEEKVVYGFLAPFLLALLVFRSRW